jgi:hypothetical protein
MSVMTPKERKSALALQFAAYCYGAADQCLPGYDREYFLWRALRWEDHARKVLIEESAAVESPALSPV